MLGNNNHLWTELHDLEVRVGKLEDQNREQQAIIEENRRRGESHRTWLLGTSPVLLMFFSLIFNVLFAAHVI